VAKLCIAVIHCLRRGHHRHSHDEEADHHRIDHTSFGPNRSMTMVTRPRTRGASCLYFGHVVHQRSRPVTHRFRYQVCGLFVDLDELSDLDRRLALFSVNRPNVFGFCERDHGPRDGSSLRTWIERHLSRAGIDVSDGPVRLLCFPRVFGYVFNPLTVWFCHRRSGEVAALVLEVSNMARETDSYVLAVDAEGEAGVFSASFDKRFYVSAFIGMDARYEVRVGTPGDRMSVTVREFEHGDETLRAAWYGRWVPLTDASLFLTLVRFPLMTVKISAAIYWQALRLLGKGVPVHQKEAASPFEPSYAGTARRERQPARSSGNGANR